MGISRVCLIIFVSPVVPACRQQATATSIPLTSLPVGGRCSRAWSRIAQGLFTITGHAQTNARLSVAESELNPLSATGLLPQNQFSHKKNAYMIIEKIAQHGSDRSTLCRSHWRHLNVCVRVCVHAVRVFVYKYARSLRFIFSRFASVCL